jgi:hypothetical protein
VDYVVQIGKAGSQAKDAIGQAGSQAQETAKQVQAEAKQIPGAADELAQTQLQAADQARLNWHVLHCPSHGELNSSLVKQGSVCVSTLKPAASSALSNACCYLADQPGH